MAAKIIKGLQHLCCESLNCSAWRLRGISSVCIETCREGEEGQSQTPFSNVQCQYKRQWAKSGTQEVLSEHQEMLLDCVSTGTGCGVSSLEIFKTLLDMGLDSLLQVRADGPRSLCQSQSLCDSATGIMTHSLSKISVFFSLLVSPRLANRLSALWQWTPARTPD